MNNNRSLFDKIFSCNSWKRLISSSRVIYYVSKSEINNCIENGQCPNLSIQNPILGNNNSSKDITIDRPGLFLVILLAFDDEQMGRSHEVWRVKGRIMVC